jgi:alpha-amylase
VKQSGDPRLLDDWRKLQTSDHFYYMCTKYFADGDVHKYFNPYDSPYDSFINFMNVLDNLRGRLPKPRSAAGHAAAPVGRAS